MIPLSALSVWNALLPKEIQNLSKGLSQRAVENTSCSPVNGICPDTPRLHTTAPPGGKLTTLSGTGMDGP